MNIQQKNTSEVANTDTVKADNKELYPPQPQDIYNLFAAADLPSNSSSYSAKYKRVFIKTKVIRSSILSFGECPEVCSRELSIAMKHK